MLDSGSLNCALTNNVAPFATSNAVLSTTKVGGVTSTIKLLRLGNVNPLASTDIGPVVAPVGTEVVRVLVLDAVTTASVPLNLTEFSEGIILKFVPVIVTTVPIVPIVGVKLINVGVGRTVKISALVNVMPLTVTEIGPVVAPVGTVVVILVGEDATTVEMVPLKRTIFSEGELLKFVPVMTTVAPTAPLVGLKLSNVGV